ncbi:MULTISPECIES: LysR family transcriptional regulator [unclassified Rhodococcus (in: high G+C Gram-positive bacteria)]|uniref:helix-turn-helix domain-containing protein n=1 Tax=unclassified Rhodococcus (in: high G+C Gram-positive bacteria) TaxID=192944 RepID=UPI0037C5C38D
MERHLGVTLFDRGTQPIRLTAGRAVSRAVPGRAESRCLGRAVGVGGQSGGGGPRAGRFSGAYGQSKLPQFARTVRRGGVSLIPAPIAPGPSNSVVVPTDGGCHRIRGALAWADRPRSPLLETVSARAEELMPTIEFDK